jgi:hypothetical protein
VPISPPPKEIVFDAKWKAKAETAEAILNPCTVAINYFSTDDVRACAVRPTLLAMRAEYALMESSGTLDSSYMTPEN